MKSLTPLTCSLALVLSTPSKVALADAERPAAVAVDLADFLGARGASADDRLTAGAIAVQSEGERLVVRWTIAPGKTGRLALDLRPGAALIQGLGIVDGPPGGTPSTILQEVDPVTFVTV
ncbi:MAG: hypothetical protein AB7I30_04135, partial [Isosphaeraceae bacterium]